MSNYRPFDGRVRSLARVGVAAALLSVLALIGCTTTAVPVASPVPTVEPETPTPEQVPLAVETVIIEGYAMSLILEDGSVSQRLLFSSKPEAAVASLTAALGEQTVMTERAEEECAPSATKTSWGSHVWLISNYDWLPAGQLFSIIVTAETVNGVVFEAAGGYRVGAESTALVASVSPDQVEVETVEGTTYEHVQIDIEGGSIDGGGRSLWGSSASAKDGTIYAIASPESYFAIVDC